MIEGSRPSPDVLANIEENVSRIHHSSLLDWLNPKGGGVRQLHGIVYSFLTWGIWMLYSNMKHISDSIPGGIGYCSRRANHFWQLPWILKACKMLWVIDYCSQTCKTSLTTPLKSGGMLNAEGIWWLWSDMQSVSNNTPEIFELGVNCIGCTPIMY